MRKIMTLVVLTCLLILQTQLAAAKSYVNEDYDFSKVRTLVVNRLDYVKTDKSPEADAIMTMIREVGVAAKLYVLDNSDVQGMIVRDNPTVDFSTLDSRSAREIQKDYMGKYADAYITAAIIHNVREMMFFEVYSAETHKLLYTYQIIGGSEELADMDTYKRLTEKFYHAFKREMANQQKKDVNKK